MLEEKFHRCIYVHTEWLSQFLYIYVHPSCWNWKDFQRTDTLILKYSFQPSWLLGIAPNQANIYWSLWITKVNNPELNILSQSYDFLCSLVILERGWGELMQNTFTSDALSIGGQRQYFLPGSNTCHGWGFRSRLSACVRLSCSQVAVQKAPFPVLR